MDIELINVLVNNGLGVASFICLILYIFKYEDKQTDTLKEISTTLASVEDNLTKLTERVDKIEEKDVM